MTAVPMYEIVLRYPDHDEVRLTDRNGCRPGEVVTIAHRRFVVTAAEEPRVPGAESRFILEPAPEEDSQ